MKLFNIKKDLTRKLKSRIFTAFLYVCASFSIISIISLIFFIVKTGLSPFLTGKISIINFLFSLNWNPTSIKNPSFGILPFIVNSLLTTFFSLIIAIPIGLGVAIYLFEMAKGYYQKILQITVELLAGIPSVVYGFFGCTFISRIIKVLFPREDNLGYNMLSAVIVLAMMILPTIISISYVSLKATPKNYKYASLALGATRWQTTYKIIIPAASTGILTGIILAIGRVVGETIAVLMIGGGSPLFIKNIFSPMRTLTVNIALDMGYASGTHRQALFSTALVLLFFILLINMAKGIIQKSNKIKNKYV